MKRIISMGIGGAWLAAALLFSVSADAQQSSVSLHAGYDPVREVNLLGTVTRVVENPETGPLGSHVIVQTMTGPFDVHIGSAKFLESNHLKLASGDSVRIIGESFATGSSSVFLARIVQKGTTAVAVRSPRGLPLWSAGARTASPATNKKRGAQ